MLIFAHGLEGSPEGRKVKAMKRAGVSVYAPDFAGMVLKSRIKLLEEVTRIRPNSVLAGSSYGGVAALYTAYSRNQSVRGLLLLAPALATVEDPIDDITNIFVPDHIECVIIHGTRDATCPIEDSRALVERSNGNVTLIEVDDEHRLERSLDRIAQEAKALEKRTRPPRK